MIRLIFAGAKKERLTGIVLGPHLPKKRSLFCK